MTAFPKLAKKSVLNDNFLPQELNAVVVDHGVEKKTSPRSGEKVKPPGKGPLAVRTDIFSGPTRDDIQVISILLGMFSWNMRGANFAL